MLAAAGARVTRRPGLGHGRARAERCACPRCSSPATSRRPRRSSSPRRCCPGSTLTVHDVGLNPLRTGFLDVLERMGARVGILNRRHDRRRADRRRRGRRRRARRDDGRARPRCRGSSTSCRSSRCSPRMAHGDDARSPAPRSCGPRSPTGSRRVTTALRAIGVHIEARPDGFVVRGVPARPRGGSIDAAGDHRIAMLGAVAGAVSQRGRRGSRAPSASRSASPASSTCWPISWRESTGDIGEPRSSLPWRQA